MQIDPLYMGIVFRCSRLGIFPFDEFTMLVFGFVTFGLKRLSCFL